MTAPLEPFRCVVVGTCLTGDVAAGLLAGQGASVVRLDPGPSQHADGTRANFPTIALTRADGGGPADAWASLDRADIIIIDADADIAPWRELSPDALAASRPSCIIWEASAFPQQELKTLAGSPGALVAAAAGAIPRGRRSPDEGQSLELIHPLPAICAGLHGAVAIVFALLGRARGGEGCRIATSQVDAFRDLAVDPTRNPEETVFAPPRERARANFDRWYSAALGGVYRCKDGGRVLFWPRLGKFMQRFADAVGAAQWKSHVGCAIGALEGPGRSSAARARLHRALAALFATRTAAEWEQLGLRSHVPLVKARTPGEWRHAAGQFDITNDAGASSLDWSSFVSVGNLGATPRARPLLHAVGGRAAAPLDGVRVIDASHILAGPIAARVLAQYGATVLRIGDPAAATSAFHNRINQGKRCIGLEILSQHGRAALDPFLHEADVFLHSFAPDRAAEAGLDADGVSAASRALVHGSVSAYGHHDVWRSGRGYEPLARAITGLYDLTAGAPGAIAWPAYVIDYSAGLLLALGVGIGLLARHRTGLAQGVTTSLVRAAHLYASLALRPEQKTTASRYAEHAGRYRVADGCILLALKDGQQGALDTILGCTDCGADRVAGWERAFAQQPAAHWLPLLRHAGIAAHSVLSVAETLRDPIALARGTVQVVAAGERQIRTIGSPNIDLRLGRARPIRLPVTLAPAASGAVPKPLMRPGGVTSNAQPTFG